MNTIKKCILIICIGLFSSCFSQENTKHIYLAGWEAEFNGDEQCQKFIETQIVDKKTAHTIYFSIELIFKNNKLAKSYDYEEGTKTERKLSDNEKGLAYIDLEPHQIFQIVKSRPSQSFLGGEIPENFTIPKFKFNAPFQYLGKFSKLDEAFNWLPFDLHLVAPIYLNFDKVFVDYSDPLNPKIIDIEELRETDNSYDSLKPNSEIVYKKMFITTQKSNDYGYGEGHTGVPSWIQYPDIPTCPKSKKTMRFLSQLKSNDAVKTKRTNINPEDEWEKQYFDHMNFWGDGDLYIFFEPESKVACFIIQNT